jgi:hypothetical protein
MANQKEFAMRGGRKQLAGKKERSQKTQRSIAASKIAP